MPPRRRPKTRVEKFVDALDMLKEINSILEDVDLRTTTDDLKVAVKASREHARALSKSLGTAVKADVPKNPLAPAAKRTAAA